MVRVMAGGYSTTVYGRRNPYRIGHGAYAALVSGSSGMYGV